MRHVTHINESRHTHMVCLSKRDMIPSCAWHISNCFWHVNYGFLTYFLTCWSICQAHEGIMSLFDKSRHTHHSYVTHMIESCPTFIHVAPMNESCPTFICHTHEWVMSNIHMSHTWMSHVQHSYVTHMNESCLTNDSRHTSHVWKGHVTYTHESCPTYMSHVPVKWVMSSIRTSHATLVR